MLVSILTGISIFAFGMATGMLLRVHHEEAEKSPETKPVKGTAQFFEPITIEEKFTNAKNIKDILGQ